MKNKFTFYKLIFLLIMALFPLWIFAQGMAKPIVFGQTITDSMKTLSASNGYSIKLTPGDILYVRVSSLTPFMKTRVLITQPGGLDFAKGNTTFGALPPPIDIVMQVSISGTYIITVFNDGNLTGAFCISAERYNSPPDAVFLNCYSSINSKFDCNSTIKTFRYSVEANSHSQIILAPSVSCLKMKGWVSDPNGNIIALDSTSLYNSKPFLLDIKGQPKTQCFYVFVVKTPDLCSDSFSISHALLSGTCATVSIQASNSKNLFCKGETIKLTAFTPIPNSTVSWTGPKNFKSTKNPIFINNVQPSQSGIYTVVANDPSNCSSTDSIEIIIHDPPKDTLIVDPKAGILCAGDTFKLNVNTNAADPMYRWSGANEYLSIEKSPIIIVPDTAKTGRWEYMITVTDDSIHCSSIDTFSVQINAKPKVTITSPVNEFICKGETLILNVSTDTLVTSFSWSGPISFKSTIQNPSITNVDTLNHGNYTVTVTDNNGCFRSDTVKVTVEEIILTVTVTPSGDGVIATATRGARPYTYTISPGGQSDTTGLFKNLSPGLYTIYVTDKYNCKDTVAVNVIVGTVQPSTEWGLSISPNPSNGFFQIMRNEFNKKDLLLSIFDGYGKMLTNFVMEGTLKTLDLSNLPGGVYMFRVSDGEKVGMMKIVILK